MNLSLQELCKFCDTLESTYKLTRDGKNKTQFFSSSNNLTRYADIRFIKAVMESIKARGISYMEIDQEFRQLSNISKKSPKYGEREDKIKDFLSKALVGTLLFTLKSISRERWGINSVLAGLIRNKLEISDLDKIPQAVQLECCKNLKRYMNNVLESTKEPIRWHEQKSNDELLAEIKSAIAEAESAEKLSQPSSEPQASSSCSI